LGMVSSSSPSLIVAVMRSAATVSGSRSRRTKLPKLRARGSGLQSLGACGWGRGAAAGGRAR
jgi:hypothetical protein